MKEPERDLQEIRNERDLDVKKRGFYQVNHESVSTLLLSITGVVIRCSYGSSTASDP